jgi:hypothetical protein
MTTEANVDDVTQAHHLLHGEEECGFRDAGYQGVEKRQEHKNRQIQSHIALRREKRRALGNSKPDRLTGQVERLNARMRAIFGHPFRVIKRQFGFTKVTIADRRGTIAHGTRCSRYATCTKDATSWRLLRTSVAAFLDAGGKPVLQHSENGHSRMYNAYREQLFNK